MSQCTLIIIVGIIALTICILYALSIWEGKHSCHHEWEILKEVPVDTGGVSDHDRIYLRCSKCGDVKCKTMK